ncbi:hypothetical protein E6W99_18640 [Metabacillus sediminilitoris]|uniref:Uncharacterized protein n=1 Tax=Metabacillus sediminilitoris TaxID=2567941 RepID=A0A4S4BTS5_9BACI|nr:hypothetical protein GMB29_09300 [Metabacillus sediminilitoris]THF77727.1 hypothetical protein E6W99_18640 [Metabacillus sediminilitoris]
MKKERAKDLLFEFNNTKPSKRDEETKLFISYFIR